MNEKKQSAWQEFQHRLIVRAMKDDNFRKELLANPKAVVENEMDKLKPGSKLPAALEIKIIEQPTNALYLVLPPMSELSDEELDGVAGGWSWCQMTI